MKKFSRILLLAVMVLSIALLSSCKGNNKNNKDDDDIPKLPGTDYSEGVETPIRPYP